ncbi:ABC transporter ATP-binding protein [Gryllotalpicola ginsengisoli]|uniref:ABC transporter ATP-binding protein n=1 Tax=Gryllotalpicola ginsengisoli TaxID=444608 RepID=UPI001FDFEA21|nr:ABC transporter ATP-binding protein [Gryllotalpicola ginsengisoli]
MQAGAGGGGRGSRISGGDYAAQRAANAQAPKIDHLLSRIAELFRPYRGKLALTVVLVLVSAGLSVVPPLLTQRVFDEALFPKSGGVVVPALVGLVVAMIVLYVVSALIGVWQTWLTATVGNRVMGALRVRLFTHLQRMELSFFTRTKTGIIQSRLQNDVGGVANVLTNTVSSVLGNTVQVIAAFVAMVLLNWQLTIVAIVLMPFLVIAQRRVGQVRARIAAATQESLSDMTAITQETLSVSGILLAKSFNRQRSEIARYSDENDNQIRLQVRQAMSGQWFFAMVQVFLSSIPAIVYLVAGWLIHGGVADISAGTIVAFTTVQARLLFPLLGILRVALDLQTSGALFARIFEYLDLKPAIADKADAVSVTAEEEECRDGDAVSIRPDGRVDRREAADGRVDRREAADGRVDRREAGARTAKHPIGIEFDHVTFRYPDAKPEERATLDDVSFRIAPGQFAAFVGPSGAGKTTVSYLIPRFYEASGGTVRFAGRDVRELKAESLVSHIGIVSQETYLFHASIAENLRYAKPGASDEELEAACRAANIHATIASFPAGYDTLVGERGYRLSGGEKQRIAIARVLLKDPEVLILDEATSALDTVSERIVQQALDTAASGRTTIAIAHRLSTIVGADVIFVIDRGRLVEQGTHAELLELGGVYAGLYRQQAELTAPVE